MKGFRSLWTVLGLLITGTIAFAETGLEQGDDLKRFRGIHWGQSLTTVRGPQLDFSMRDGPIEYYTRENDKLEIGSLAIRKIQYGFWKGRFVEARITVLSNAEAAVRELRLFFGEECAAERRHVEWFRWQDLCTWEKPRTRITLTSFVTTLGKEFDECTVTIASKRIMKEMKIQE